MISLMNEITVEWDPECAGPVSLFFLLFMGDVRSILVKQDVLCALPQFRPKKGELIEETDARGDGGE